MCDRCERLHRELEHRSVRSMGPYSPFFKCSYCGMSSTSPFGVKHDPECILAPPLVHQSTTARRCD
jgi:hypothetical protein